MLKDKKKKVAEQGNLQLIKEIQNLMLDKYAWF